MTAFTALLEDTWPLLRPPIRSQVLDVRSSDGAMVRGQIYTPEEPARETAPSCLILPGMGIRANYYESFARSLAIRGWTAVTLDLRGQGESSERPQHFFGSQPSFGYREIVTRDLPAAVAACRKSRPSAPVLVVAHSLAGQLSVLSTEGGHMSPDGLVLVAAGTAHWKAWPRRMRNRAFLTIGGIALAAKLLPRYPGSLLGFGGDQPRRLMKDWVHNAFTGRYGYLESPPRVDGPPVLALKIEGDIVAPAEAVDSLTARIPAVRLSRRTVAPTSRHPWRRHYSWVKRCGAVSDEIVAWHRKHMPEGP